MEFHELKVPEVIKDGSQGCNGGIGKVSFVHVIFRILEYFEIFLPFA